MKTTSRFLTLAAATLLGALSSFAQTTTPTTPVQPVTPTTGGAGGAVTPGTGRPSTVVPVGPMTGGTMPPTTVGGGTSGDTTTPPRVSPPVTPVGPGNASPHMPNENASDTAKAVMTVIQQFDAKRDQAMAERKALMDKLQAAKTDAERQAIITQLRAETQAEKEQQAQLGKQIREELKKLRDARRTGG